MEFRRKIAFFQYIYYLTVSKDEHCALSAFYGEGIANPIIMEYCSICFLSRFIQDSLPWLVSARIYYLYVKPSHDTLMFCPL